jgi:ribosomal protein S6--L-glutamate ligase
LFPNYETRFEYPGKIGQSLLFGRLRCPRPETRAWPSVEKFRASYPLGKEYPHKLPFFLKADTSHEAAGIYLVTDGKVLESALESLSSLEKSGFKGFISQELISSQGNVLRAVILGKRIVSYWKRPNRPGQAVSTIGRGARVDKEWRAELQEKGRIHAQSFATETGVNLAAIDFVFSLIDPDPQALFLEINYYFGRRGLGGSQHYYGLLHAAIQEWLGEKGFDPKSVKLV